MKMDDMIGSTKCRGKITENINALTTAEKVVNFGFRVLSSVINAPLLPIWSLKVYF